MRPLLLILMLVGCLSPTLVRAQTASGCSACIRGAGCDSTRDACIAECRARLFSVDPKRATCTTGCSNAAGQCTKSAEDACRERNMCR
jgi:hypothetical protein